MILSETLHYVTFLLPLQKTYLKQSGSKLSPSCGEMDFQIHLGPLVWESAAVTDSEDTRERSILQSQTVSLGDPGPRTAATE